MGPFWRLGSLSCLWLAFSRKGGSINPCVHPLNIQICLNYHSEIKQLVVFAFLKEKGKCYSLCICLSFMKCVYYLPRTEYWSLCVCLFDKAVNINFIFLKGEVAIIYARGTFPG